MDNSTGLKALLESRRFWVAILDTVISLVTLVVSTYFGQQKEFTLAVIGILQPVFIILINGLTTSDTQSATLAAQIAQHQMTLDTVRVATLAK